MSRRFFIALLLLITGAVLSAVSLYHHTILVHGLAAGPSFCNINEYFDCDRVISSAWSTFLGIPLATYGLAFYAALLLLALCSGGLFFNVLLVTSSGAALLSVFLFVVSEFLIGSLCLICTGMHLVNLGLLLAALAATREPLRARFHAGFDAVLAFPAYVLGRRGEKGEQLRARRCSAIFVVLLLLALLIPETLVVPRLSRHYQDAAVREWRESATYHVPLVLDSLTGDVYQGRPEAPIRLVEFSDFQCPACRRFYFVIEELRREYGNDLLYVLKNYPLDEACNPSIKGPYHNYACYSASFAFCAGEQGKHWEAVSFLNALPQLATVSPRGSVIAAIDSGVSLLALDPDAMRHCMQSGRYKAKVRSDVAEAEKLEIPGTPFILINERLAPRHDMRTLKAIFDAILAEQKRQGVQTKAADLR